MPMFPHRMKMIALWEQDTNWGVFQAFAHCDIDTLMDSNFDKLRRADKPEEVSLFDYWSNIAQGVHVFHSSRRSMRAVMQTVRTFLAQWLTTAGQEPNWQPVMPGEHFEFDLCKNVIDVERCDIRDCKLIWTCQQALQKEVSRTWNEHPNLPLSHVRRIKLHLDVGTEYQNLPAPSKLCRWNKVQKHVNRIVDLVHTFNY